jgi:V8-like Glu-specific endopeptidase
LTAVDHILDAGEPEVPVSRFPWRPLVVLGACALAVQAPLTMLPSWAGDTARGRAAADAGYWTADRLRAARPVDRLPDPAGQRAAAPKPPPPGTPQGRFFAGIPAVGTFFASDTSGDTSCTGSVITSEGRDLVLTAGHCAYGWLQRKAAHRIFVPRYDSARDAAHQPYGFFGVDKLVLDPRYRPSPATSAVTNLDFAFARLSANAAGQQVEDATGGLRLTATPGYALTTTVIGYPQGTHNPARQAITCSVPTSRLPGYQQLQMRCGGYYNGVSGGPWIANYDPTTQTGDVVGIVAGRGAGGDDANDDWLSYSPYFDRNILDLYADAEADRPPARRPYQVPQDPAVPGTAARWRDARLLASGDFTGSGQGDLAVVWTDGAVSVFPSDGYGNLLPERILQKPNARWRTARAVTAGDFDGTSRSDLMVLWQNGQVSSFRDVTPTTLGQEQVYAGPGTAPWRATAHLVAGRFSAGSRVADLVARRTDGSLVLYTGVHGGRFGTPHQLRSPNATWRHVTLLPAGQYSGAATWDLLVRWPDGEVDTYPQTTARGLGSKRRLLPSHSVWSSAAAVTAARSSPNSLVDDITVRWPTGETTAYLDTRTGHLGTRHTVVSVPSAVIRPG